MLYLILTAGNEAIEVFIVRRFSSKVSKSTTRAGVSIEARDWPSIREEKEKESKK